MSHISLQHVYKSFQKGIYVINDISLEIFEDEFLVLVGPSGSGKTTTLRMIAGLEELTQGELYMNDQLKNDEDPSTRQLSFVFQNYALLPQFTVYQNIAFGLLNHRLTKLDAQKRVEDVARKLSLYEKLGSYPMQLSGGQRQRVALARALVDNEKLILFDEPLSNLDAVLRTQMRSELIRIQKAFNMTCIYVTHDQIEAMAMATRMVLMMEGKIIQVGTPYQMYHQPVHLDVATFIGSPETNVFEVSYLDHQLIFDGKPMVFSDDSLMCFKKNQLSQGYITIRPHDIKVELVKSSKTITGKPTIVEHFGSNKLIHIEYQHHIIRVLVDKSYEIKDEIYLDLSGTSFVFDRDKNRVTTDKKDRVTFSQEPKDMKMKQVIRELINYGYTISYDASKPDILCDKIGEYVLQTEKDNIHFNQPEDLLTHFHYIKQRSSLDKEILWQK
ncbi:MAG: ABC transporter ATP-binding protein [Acholeplasmataceae bacterium]|jgi:multiple sugar transport system ATP-binding protein|nr:ABC transporter ATP-binding protein [Acholeplasmataceae bacterium]